VLLNLYALRSIVAGYIVFNSFSSVLPPPLV
jgi:hypothetical protein